jgi:hypothetical protein
METIEWFQGPSICLSCGGSRREVVAFHILEGYTYRDFRIKQDGMVVKKANWTIHYVAANSSEAIAKYIENESCQTAKVDVSADIASVWTLGRVNGVLRRSGKTKEQMEQTAHSSHAALILSAETRSKWLVKSEITISVEVGLVRRKSELDSQKSELDSQKASTSSVFCFGIVFFFLSLILPIICACYIR